MPDLKALSDLPLEARQQISEENMPKSWTVRPSAASSKALVIKVAFDKKNFYVKGDIKHPDDGHVLKLDSQGGVQLTWSKFVSVEAAWQRAKTLAKW
jgi:hypothetical protein